ncbi:uncharacterized protein LOC126691074 [Quercus robur]|uniref:uncharacterized protein LOC126691074 n=1 Tax=Quercus robur TaxID=38942 RepID=UPI002163FD4C|nr:uncharacterized protein LOC126691074 [Quercus robur]
MDCYALRNIFHDRVAKGDLVIKAGKRADPRMCRPEVAMTFFVGREDLMEEEAENMASSNSTSPPLVDEEMVTTIQHEDKIHSFLEGIGHRPMAKRDTAQALTRVMERNYEVAAVEGRDEEDGEPNSLNPIQQPEEIHVVEEFVKEAPKCMNDVVKNVREELVEVNLVDEGEGEKMVKIKDGFPLPNVDNLVDAVAGHKRFSFMDGYSGYNQILMDPADAPKIAFRTPFGNYFYRVMPFRLKNEGATYQRTMTLIFGDMLHKQVEDYVDDLVVKAKNPFEHLVHLRQVFERCGEHNLRMNPSKCAFRVSSGKFLGFLVHHRGIDLDPTKGEAITTLSPPTNLKELRSFVGKVYYLRRFITSLAEILKPLMEQTKKGVTFVWCDQCQKSFKKIQIILADPHTMVAPIPGKPLLLYIANTEQSLGALLAQEHEGVEKPVYYISKLIKGPKLRYSTAEKVYLSLAFAVTKFNHYFLGHRVQLVAKSNPVKYLFTRPQLLGRMVQWAILTSCLNIECIRPTAIKGQAVADLLANFPRTSDSSPPLQEVMVTEEQEWSMYFDGSSTFQGGGIVILKSPGEEHMFAYKLHFPCPNNEAKYEALLVGMKAARRLGIKKLKVFGDSKLVIRQVKGIYGVKNPSLAAYRAAVQWIMEHFDFIRYKVVNRGENKLANSLATLATKSVLKKEKMTLRVEKQPGLVQDELCFPQDWRKPLLKAMTQGKYVGSELPANMKDFLRINGDLFLMGAEGLLMKCVSR